LTQASTNSRNSALLASKRVAQKAGHVAVARTRIAEPASFRRGRGCGRQLVSLRERPFDYGVLGDVLIDQGKVREGAAAYQKMVDLRPDLQSYARRRARALVNR
jgi:hypothetical protein